MNKYKKFVQSRGENYEQPYEHFPHHIKISVFDFEVWVDLSATSEKYFSSTTDRAIANAFLTQGKNSMRRSINSLLKAEENYDFLDPLSLDY